MKKTKIKLIIAAKNVFDDFGVKIDHDFNQKSVNFATLNSVLSKLHRYVLIGIIHTYLPTFLVHFMKLNAK